MADVTRLLVLLTMEFLERQANVVVQLFKMSLFNFQTSWFNFQTSRFNFLNVVIWLSNVVVQLFKRRDLTFKRRGSIFFFKRFVSTFET